MADGNTKYTLEPTLKRTYELQDLDILPKDYGSFLAECAQIYHEQTGIKKINDDAIFKSSFTIVGQISYASPDDQTKEIHPRIIRNHTYYENLGENGKLPFEGQVSLQQDDFAQPIKSLVQQINTQLDTRFPQREGQFPMTYFKEFDLSSKELEVWTRFYNELVPLSMYITLKAESSSMTNYQKRTYMYVGEPLLSIEIHDKCSEYSTLESIANSIETHLTQRYAFQERKTQQGRTERRTVELAGLCL